ncbi:MAGE family-domain-containing protein [Fimicolochytrium jonesii]|uniref:MAGE family-domain-containing protein n=1 Tax=Fimicolochytrium jonesii TaxID=1396493 RepID=UPI0022FDBBD2|nr:MAGE family-domain-containing protein [Fimicolochytrium jonesii]KAI8820592.1 MAGE family-domain-containing protein [Fimicolochytrium jonesii]
MVNIIFKWLVPILGTQPRRSNRRHVQEDHEEEEEEETQDVPEAQQQNQPSQSVPAALRYVQTNMSEEDVNRMVKDLVRLALAMEQRRQPLKREDITKRVLKDHPRAFNVVFERAQERLRSTFGMEMAELTTRDKRQTATQAARRAATATQTAKSTSTRSYVLRSTLTPQERAAVVDWGDEEFVMVLLCIILGIILVNGKRIEEGDLTTYLKRLGLNLTSPRPHRTLGLISDHITTFTKHAYLDKVKTPGVDADVVEYSWGPRAKVECSERDMVAFVVGVYPDLTVEVRERLERDVGRLAGLEREEEEGEEVGATGVGA